MDELLRKAVITASAWGGAIMKPAKESPVLTCVLSYNMPADWDNITNALDGTTANGRCFMSGKPSIVQNQVISQPKGGITHHDMYAIAVFPIVKGNDVVGTLEIVKDAVGSKFDINEIKKLKEIAVELAKF